MQTVLRQLAAAWVLVAGAAVAQPAAESRYHLSVDGPLASFEEGCDDPCEIDRTEAADSGGFLKKGITVLIEDGTARFTFLDIQDTADGLATTKQYGQFRIDRPRIELTLQDHDVVLFTAMDDGERKDQFRKTIELKGQQ